jgi:hypothetical protein
MSKSKDKWEAYLDQIPEMPSRIVTPAVEPDDDALDMAAILSELPQELADKVVSAKMEDTDTQWERLVEHRWCLCEMVEGDFPRVYVFPTLRRLTAAIAKREGNETAVWPLFGVPLSISKPLNVVGSPESVVRYLLLPNQKAAVVSKTEKFDIIDQSLLPENIETQDEGWLGDPAYLEGKYYEEGFIEADSFTNDPDMLDEDDGDVSPVNN